MVDRPQDQPSREREGGSTSEPPREIGGRDVIAYLRHHPNFLERHPEALRLLRAPIQETETGVVDFQHFMLERLRQDTARLQLEQRNLVAAGRGNLAGQGRVHRAVLAIIGATTFEQLLQVVTTDLAVLLDVDVVTIGVESSTSPTTRLPIPGIHLLKAGTVEGLLGPEREVLLRAGVRGEASLFGAAAGLVKSHVLARLSFGRTAPVGLLCIGTRRPASLPPGFSTELLGFLARSLGITIRQWLDPTG